MPKETPPSAALVAARQRIADADAALVALSASVTDPNDPRFVEADAEVEAARAAARRQERLDISQRKALNRAEYDKLMEERKVAADKAIALAQQRIVLAGQLDKSFAQLGQLLQAWAELGDECCKEVHFVHKHDTNTAWNYALLDAARGSSARFSGALEWAMHKARIGDVGIWADLVLRRPLGEPFSIADAAKRTAEHLTGTLRKSLANPIPHEGRGNG